MAVKGLACLYKIETSVITKIHSPTTISTNKILRYLDNMLRTIVLLALFGASCYAGLDDDCLESFDPIGTTKCIQAFDAPSITYAEAFQRCAAQKSNLLGLQNQEEIDALQTWFSNQDNSKTYMVNGVNLFGVQVNLYNDIATGALKIFPVHNAVVARTKINALERSSIHSPQITVTSKALAETETPLQRIGSGADVLCGTQISGFICSTPRTPTVSGQTEETRE